MDIFISLSNFLYALFLQCPLINNNIDNGNNSNIDDNDNNHYYYVLIHDWP